MDFIKLVLTTCSLFGLSSAVLADIRAIIIDPSLVPYSQSGDNYQNSPDNYKNSSDNYKNSEDNYQNSGDNFENSAANSKNSIHGNRRIIFVGDGSNTFIGYHIYSPGGELNLYNTYGRRVAFLPSGGHTQSLISGGDLCGFIGLYDGKPTIGITQACFYRFALEN